MRKMVILTIILSFILSYGIGLPIFADSSALPSYENVYDTYANWAENDIDILLGLGIMEGDGNFAANPQSNITRAEFIALLVRGIFSDNGVYGSNSFTDVKTTDWFYGVTAQAKALGLIVGDGGRFRPYAAITREEIMLIISRLDFLSGNPAKTAFKDISKNYKYMSNLQKAVGSGILSGYPDNTFKPYKTATRAECAAMVRRLLDAKTPDKPTASQLDEIKTDAANYLQKLIDAKNQAASPNYNIAISVGRELANNHARETLAKLTATEGATLNQGMGNLSWGVTESSGAIVRLKATYSLTSERTGPNGRKSSQTYNAATDMGLVKVNGVWMVYDTNDTLARQDGTNLVWDYITGQSPDVAENIPGLDVLSPTWYEVGKNDAAVHNNADVNYVIDAHKNGYSVWPLFKNAFGSWTTEAFLKDEKNRENGIETLLKSALKLGFDGINVDFENMDVSNKNYLSEMVNELAFAMHYIGMPVSVDVSKYEPTSANWSMCFDRTALGRAADYVMLMAYDQNGSFSTKAGSVAQLDWVENAVKLTLKEVPAQKLLLGLPFYTRVWQTQNGKVISTYAVSMGSAQSLISRNNAALVWDEASGQTLATWYVNGSKYNIWLENAYSIGLKSALVDKYRLSGTAGWRKGFETADVWNVLADVTG